VIRRDLAERRHILFTMLTTCAWPDTPAGPASVVTGLRRFLSGWLGTVASSSAWPGRATTFNSPGTATRAGGRRSTRRAERTPSRRRSGPRGSVSRGSRCSGRRGRACGGQEARRRDGPFADRSAPLSRDHSSRSPVSSCGGVESLPLALSRRASINGSRLSACLTSALARSVPLNIAAMFR
jgi:hypothetical protein